MRPHLPHKTRLPLKRRGKWRSWVTHVHINGNPIKRGHTISALTRRAKETASLNVLRWNSENNQYRGLGRSVMTHCGIRQQIRFVLILFSIWQYVEICFAEPNTIFWCSLSS